MMLCVLYVGIARRQRRLDGRKLEERRLLVSDSPAHYLCILGPSEEGHGLPRIKQRCDAFAAIKVLVISPSESSLVRVALRMKIWFCL
jgi:hypothetical protein